MRTRPGDATHAWIRASRLEAVVLARPVTDLGLPARVLQACRQAGIGSVAEALGTEEASFVALRGVGRRSWQQLVAAVRRALLPLAADGGDGGDAAREEAPTGLPARTRLALVRLGSPAAERLARWPREAVLALPDIDETIYARLVGAESARGDVAAPAAGADLDPSPSAGAAPVSELEHVLACLDAGDRDLLAARVGLHGSKPQSLAALAGAPGARAEELAAKEATCRARILERCPAVVQAWRDAVAQELAVQGGIVRADRLGPGPLARLGRTARDTHLPLRLLAFLFPTDLHLVGDALATLDRVTCRRIVHALARLRARLPLALPRVKKALRRAGLPPVPAGLLHWLLHQDAQFEIVFHAQRGEVLRRRRGTVGDRIEHVLRGAGGALALSELLFRYRDRYRRARRSRLLDNLWAETRFVEIGHDVWDLRERHVDQAELIEAEAARVRDILCTVGGRHHVAELVDGGPSSDRVLFLLRDCLRRDPALRNLGRGAFCPRAMRVSTQIEALQHALRSAMGELPLERFLANQDAASRALRTRLLRENHLFVEIAPDRIDSLDNYPFNSERLATLLRTVELHLEQHDGFDRVQGVLAAVDEAGLGGEFLTPHMLGDILRRHGRFDTLEPDLVALRSRGLRAWIQQRSREAIRRAAHGLTAFEIQAEVPELAQFAQCLEHVIAADPMVQSSDGMHYHVV